ncbi:hypothetical protein Poli38472_006412 [Pythium oligandrum]|uniref:Uncharacterized protein n=1 Tax=Pythium oligandrum TaxID=41045 RepID=A0A8K1FE96_PYTOL|nr:hypothetical protein Poli38472_006412 [Pythium oligandrum]|eukprot:TMW56402.1 hypothetical protein Poli38472_006412 [Pythium oligandrum]
MRGMASPRSSRMRMMTAHDSQEIRVCALVLSVLAFFLFIGAEIVPLDDRGVVFTLVALGTLGFAWIGPLTVLAGIMRYPKFKWWQPFQGGTEFVWMQAFGWSLHAVVLTSAAVVLANARMEKWIQGQYLVMGIAGFIAQVLLNLSIGSFNEQLAELPVVPLEWNTKAVVSMLVSSSSVVLYLIFDVFSEKLQSNIMLYAGVAEFVLSALMIHVFYGYIEIPGYRVWQPFEGGRTFLLLQYLGWQFFAINITKAAFNLPIYTRPALCKI